MDKQLHYSRFSNTHLLADVVHLAYFTFFRYLLANIFLNYLQVLKSGLLYLSH